MIKLIIFDLDGTLLDSVDDLGSAVNLALSKQGFPTHSTASYKYFVGNGVAKLIERAVPKGTSAEVIDAVYRDFSDYYSAHYADKTVPYDGVDALLGELQKQKLLLAVASNKPDIFTKSIISERWNGVFAAVHGQREEIPKKPNPQIAYNIMKEIGAEKAETLLIGDTNVDIETAKSAGIRSVGCLWGFRTKEELEAAGADFIIEKPSEILDILANLKGANI